MQSRQFGTTDLQVSELGLGCARIGGIFQQGSASGSGGFVELLHAAHDAGITFYDTSDLYSQGESETLIGRAFRGRRHRVVIASKAGYTLPGRRKLAATLKPLLRPVIRRLGLRRDKLPGGMSGALSQDFSPEYLKKAVEASLKRLRSDYLDLFQLHSPPLDVVERGDWVDALDRLSRAGKVRYYGVSCDSVEVGAAALRYAQVASLQFTVSLLEQRPAEQLLPAVRERRIGAIARETLGNGLLVKRADELDVRRYCQSDEEAELKKQQLAEYRELAARAGVPLSRYALDFAKNQPGISVALIGVKSREQLTALLREVG